jgi:uncharacterized protein
MKILMTGGTGLVGQELGLALYKKGHQILVVSRDQKKAHLKLPFPCEVVEGDLSKSPLSSTHLTSVDVVVNLMGEGIADKRWSDKQKKKIHDSRVLSTHNLVKSFSKAPSIFVSTSATGIYGDGGSLSLTEASESGTGFLEELCQDWEKVADSVKELSGSVRVVKFRLAPILASQGGALKKMLPAFQAGVGGRLGDGQQWMSWIHLDDVVQAFISAIENSQFHGVYNLTSPHAVTNLEFSKTIASVLKRNLGPAIPAIALKLLFGEMSQVLLASQKVKPQKLLDLNFEFKFPDLKSALLQILKFQHQGEEVLEVKQFLPIPIDQVFSFFADAKNLEKITPSNLKFHITQVSGGEIKAGTVIDYNLKIQGIPVKWKTLIRKWEPPFVFVDEALKSPYRFWYHTHSFETLGQGTLMQDQVRFVLPFGRVGWLLGYNKVTGDVRRIFDFRRKTVADLMNLS